tara:strand:+ start:95 stop:469 length:375 start_codon:yes stop_codon:yes gene_type:complete
MTKEERKAYDKQRYQDNTEARQQHYQDNKEVILAKQRATRDARSLEIFEYKGGACNHCSIRELDYLGMYDYHHIDPATKLYQVSNILHGPMDRVYAEVDKCLLLCANCHRKEHITLNKARLNED